MRDPQDTGPIGGDSRQQEHTCKGTDGGGSLICAKSSMSCKSAVILDMRS